ncbi:ATP-dependent DNA helicase [Hypomontagnella submonticulosa]|nr:ATP-dependent DNA helicase [Hypomontagnella submonticulosa]
MSDYDSGDELLADMVIDAFIPVAGKKRARSPADDDDDQQQQGQGRDFDIAKRFKIQDKRITEENKRDAFLGDIAKSILKETFGYDEFRHEQFAAIVALLRGENALVIFPTGAGKSLCYQIPAIAFEIIDAVENSDRTGSRPGITIVVSPLIALMKDQVDALLRKHVPAACLDSTKTHEQVQQINTAIRDGTLRLLYCAPERLNNEGFVESMKYVPGGVRMVAVDEAHCISEWGHSFRPDYLKVARFVQEIHAERVISLTATATPRVADDVAKAFKVDKKNVFRTSPYRPNLQLLAESVDTRQDKYPKMFAFLKKHKGPTLVYVTLQKQAAHLADDLRDQGFDAVAFHAGLKTEVKTQIQDDFMAGKITIVVATIAFGMGIDKADIRNILHFDLSSTVEEYSQQVGRAGRDGKPSHCMFYICREDFYLRENFARGDLPSRASLRRLLKDIFRQPVSNAQEGQVIKLNLTSLGRVYDMRANPLAILLATLELRFGLLRAVTPEYTSYKYEALEGYRYWTRNDHSKESKAISGYSQKKGKLYDLDMNWVVGCTDLLRTDVVRKLEDWHNRGIILLKKSGVENKYKILEALPRTAEDIEELTDELYKDMEAREQDALKRTQQVADLITGDTCFALAIAQYFGMGLPGGKEKCGHCTRCLTGKRVKLPPKQTPPVDHEGIQRILDACNVRDDPRFLARIAFGIKSPRVFQLKLQNDPVFASLSNHDFEVVPAECVHDRVRCR